MAVWSRSGRHAIVSVSPHIYDPAGQAMLEVDQAAELAALLTDEGSFERFEAIDDDANELMAEWDPRGRWVAVEVMPVRNTLTGQAIAAEYLSEWPADSTLIRLAPGQAEELARLLAEPPAA